MNKQLLRKLMAGLLICAVLLASVIAFADGENPADSTTAATEESVERDASADPTEEQAETIDPANGDSEPGNTEDGEANPADPADDGDEDVDATVDEDGATVDEDNAAVDEIEDADTEGADAGSDEGMPVPPPIHFGAAPEVEGVESEGDNANAENGIAPLYFHKHEHVYVLEDDPEAGPNPEIQITSSCVDGVHTVYMSYHWFYRCAGCSDVMYKDSDTSTIITQDHIDYDDDGVCDACDQPINGSPTTKDEPCIHPDVDWGEPVSEEVLEAYAGIYSNYDVNTDKIANENGTADLSLGHQKHLAKTYKAHCEACNADVTQVEREWIYEPHSFKNGKCTICGYKQPVSTKKKAEDTRVRMGVKLMEEIRKLAGDGATVSLRNEELAYTAAELASVQAISDPFERALMLLAALGYGDEVDYAIQNQGLEVSDAALALIEQFRGRDVLPEAAEAFLSTAKVNGATRDVVTISLVLSDSDDAKSYTFYKDGSNLYWFE